MTGSTAWRDVLSRHVRIFLIVILGSLTLTFSAPGPVFGFVDAISGGGVITTTFGDATGGFGRFGIAVGIQNDATLAGHLAYHDQTSGFSMTSDEILTYTPGCSPIITGTANSNLGRATFAVSAQDNELFGTPDVFTIVARGEDANLLYRGTGPVVHGSIKARGPACPD